MTVRITGKLTSPLATELFHGPSGSRLDTVAPVASGGDGSRFSPIDLFAASVGSCGATAMNLCAQRNEITLSGVEFSVESEVAEDPRRVAKLRIDFRVHAECSTDEYLLLVQAAENCPIKRSIHPDIEVSEEFVHASGKQSEEHGRSSLGG